MSFLRLKSLIPMAMGVGILAFALFSFSLEHDFLNWDDEERVTENADIRGLDGVSLVRMFSSFCVSNYTPLERISCALDYQIFGMNPWGFHFTNVLLHALNAAGIFILAWWILQKASGRDDGPLRSSDCFSAALAALIFAVHPLRVESVAWISERRDVLSLFWMIPCMLFHLRSTELLPGNPAKERYRWVSIVFFTLSILSKATMVMLPLVLLLMDFYPLRRWGWKDVHATDGVWRCIWEKAPFFFLSLVFGLVAIWGQGAHGAMPGLEPYPLEARGLNSFRAMVFYVEKWLLPLDLSPVYPTAPHGISGMDESWWLSLLWVLLVSGVALGKARQWPAFSVVWGIFLIWIIPFTGLLQSGNQMAADRYSYLATLPFGFLLGFGFWKAGRRPGKIMGGILVLLISAWGLGTIHQISHWKNSLALWEKVVGQVPHEQIPLNNYSSALIVAGKPHLARVMARDSIRKSPRWDLSWHNYGVALSLSGHRGEAVEALQKSLGLNFHSSSTHFALANLLFLKGDAISARKHYFQSAQLGWTGERLVNLGICLHETGHVNLAVKYLSYAANMREPSAFLIWAKILAQKGDFPSAIGILDTGYRLTRHPEILELKEKIQGAERRYPAEKDGRSQGPVRRR